MNLRPFALAALLATTARAQGAAPSAAGEAAVAPRAPGEWVEVQLKSGPKFRGALAGEDERNLRLRSAAGTVRTIPRASIATIVPIEAPLASEVKAPPPEAPAGAAAPAAGAIAAGAEEGAGTMVGLGVNLLDLGSTGASLYVPIQLGESARVELQLAFATSISAEVDSGSLGLGGGIFGTRRVADQVGVYGGGRVVLLRETIADEHATSWRIAAAVGAEWIPVPRVALGVEGQAGLEFGSGEDDDAFGTTGLAFVRVFVW